MRRSLLFIPANTPAMLQNADIFETDAIIFDLEDAISVTEKDAARDLLSQYLKLNLLNDVELIVRINDIDSPYVDEDIKTLFSWKIDAIMLPKASKKAIDACHQKLLKLEKKYKRETLPVIAIIEQAKSLFEVEAIASHPRVSGLLLGAEDLATDLQVERTIEGEEILLARQMVIYAAKAHQKDAIDTPYTDVSNKEGLLFDTEHAKKLGMDAKACIHPIQIDTINEIMMPSLKEIEYAKRILLAEKEAFALGKGAFSVDGKMIDKPIILRAKKLLEKVKS
ncbi:MAG: CoA ester lyase [Acholeplasmataceae bacterium]|jgi:citrate lyase subunit beta/citryl-CoA lyase|nr:CoA ester lyase [Acholeplasmataceae bacterium]